jgi:hypothetical protein
MNFEYRFEQGLKGLNFGLPTGIPEIDRLVGGIQREAIYGIAAGPKVGKTTFTDYGFVIKPSEYYIAELLRGNPKNLEVEWIYFSFEISRVKKEFKYVTYYMAKDYGITTFDWKDEVYELSPNYLEGKMRDNEDKVIIPSEEHQRIVLEIYENKIIPLFGRYDRNGVQTEKGLIIFVDVRDNPTGIRNYLGRYSSEHGTWIKSKYNKEVGKNHDGSPIYEVREKRESWKPNNPNKFTIIVTDHLRKLKNERNFQKKQTVDKMIEYQVEFRNWCGFTFVDIIHLNRGMSDVQRLKYNNEFIYPTGDDIKETGNLSEEADYIFTMMNPNDEKYGLSKHFGLQIKSSDNSEIYPNYISVHLVESRDTECPIHFRTIMKGNINSFQPLVENDGYGNF